MHKLCASSHKLYAPAQNLCIIGRFRLRIPLLKRKPTHPWIHRITRNSNRTLNKRPFHPNLVIRPPQGSGRITEIDSNRWSWIENLVKVSSGRTPPRSEAEEADFQYPANLIERNVYYRILVFIICTAMSTNTCVRSLQLDILTENLHFPTSILGAGKTE